MVNSRQVVAATINSAVHEWPGVGSVVASSWELAAPDVRRSHYVPPDTCVDVVVAIDLDGRMAPIVAPPNVTFAVMVPTPGGHYLGARCHPGHHRLLVQLRSLEFPTTASSVHDARIELVARLEALASPRPTWIDEAVHFVRDDVTCRVSSLARKLGVSARTLHRGMVEHVGVTPKAFLRVERVRRAAADIAAGACASAVAAATGFADQAHLVRELRTLLGVSTRDIQTSYTVSDFFKRSRA